MEKGNGIKIIVPKNDPNYNCEALQIWLNLYGIPAQTILKDATIIDSRNMKILIDSPKDCDIFEDRPLKFDGLHIGYCSTCAWIYITNERYNLKKFHEELIATNNEFAEKIKECKAMVPEDPKQIRTFGIKSIIDFIREFPMFFAVPSAPCMLIYNPYNNYTLSWQTIKRYFFEKDKIIPKYLYQYCIERFIIDVLDEYLKANGIESPMTNSNNNDNDESVNISNSVSPIQ